jgi:arylsulfatase A-like enzyme
MNHHFFLRRLAPLVAVVLLFASMASEAAKRPNLLVIITDEHNFRTLGCYRGLMSEDQAFVWGKGVKVETPNIDSIAENGAICDRFYATSPVCTPSRAAFMTGFYPQNTGAIQNNLPLKDEMVTFAEVLRRKGYATGYIGKWHLDGPGKPEFTPKRKFGFEDNHYMYNRGHYKKMFEEKDGLRAESVKGQMAEKIEGANPKNFTTDFLTDRAIEFIRAKKDKPFCCVVSIPDPHGPNAVRAPYDTMFLDLPFQQPKTAQSDGENLPSYAATQKRRFNKTEMALYFGMVKCVDDNVGRMIAALRETGDLENTFIVFTSDHGDLCGEHGRENKSLPMEASARIPFVLKAPGVVKAGTIIHEPLANVDFKPTVLSLMGIADSVDEGRDASRLFTGHAKDADRRDMTFVRIGGGKQKAVPDEDSENLGKAWMGAFTSRYKFIVAPGEIPCLFDRKKDPNELTNWVHDASKRQIIKRLGVELLNYAKSKSDPLLNSASVRADLDWAAHSDVPYEPKKPEETDSIKRKATGKKAL